MDTNSRQRILLFFAILISIFSIVQYNRTIYLLYIFQLLLGLGCVLLIVLEIYVNVKLKEKILSERKRPFVILLFLAIFLIPVSTYLVRTDGGKKIILKVGASTPSEFIDLYLFKDNSYKLLHGGPTSGIYYRGGYTYSNDTLRIQNYRLDYLYPNQIFVYEKDKHAFIPVEIEDSTDFKSLLYVKKLWRVFEWPGQMQLGWNVLLANELSSRQISLVSDSTLPWSLQKISNR